jgi:glycosyltransferase involved in cell wall biosynthesis
MKVAMVDPSLFTGRYDDSLCAALAQRGHNVTLLGRPLRDTDAIRPQGYVYKPRFFRFGEAARSVLGDGLPGRVAKALDYGLDAMIGPLGALAGDVVHFQWLPFAGADARLLNRLRDRAALVHTVHNAKPYHGDGKASAQARGYLALLRRFDALIVHGQSTVDALIGQGIDPARLHIIPHPPMRLAKASANDLVTVPKPAAPRILFFGTIRPYKGLDLLIEAALTLWHEGLDFELAIAGKPFMPVEPMLAPIHAAGFGHRLVTDLGFLTEGRLDAHLRAADMIAFPYREIDSSGAFLSALGYGAAMITSDAGMFGDVAQQCVARFGAGDSAALADRLRDLICDRAARARLGAAALTLNAEMGDWAQAATSTEQAYADAIMLAHGRGGAA